VNALRTQNGRAPVQHCAELFRASEPRETDTSAFTDFGAALARRLTPAIAGLLGGAKVRVSAVGSGRRDAADEPVEADSRVVGTRLAFGVTGAQMAVSLPLADLLALTDRMFGGEGDVPDDLPEELPLMADLVASQLDTVMSDAMGAVLPSFGRPEYAGRSYDAAALVPFAREDHTFAMDLVIAQADRADWAIRLSACPRSHSILFGGKNAAAGKARPRRRASDLTQGPMADLPFDLTAVVAELSLPLARVSTLRPNDTIPLALSREVPLRIGDDVIAYGTIGSRDDQVALQLTRVF